MTENDLVLLKLREYRRSKTPTKQQIQAEFNHEKLVEMCFSFLHNPYGGFWSHTYIHTGNQQRYYFKTGLIYLSWALADMTKENVNIYKVYYNNFNNILLG